jgi:hypothetical protein
MHVTRVVPGPWLASAKAAGGRLVEVHPCHEPLAGLRSGDTVTLIAPASRPPGPTVNARVLRATRYPSMHAFTVADALGRAMYPHVSGPDHGTEAREGPVVAIHFAIQSSPSPCA